jgi:3-isopropylmalate/(R)-2-methylmalate dehydratase small subunit
MSPPLPASSSAAPLASLPPEARVSGRAIRLDRANVDTDLIIPSRFLKGVGREGLREGAFADLRATPSNPFASADAANAPILIAGPNFGCGSSREHAVWALQQIGIRAVVAPSFGSIFQGNALRNGLVPVQLASAFVERMMRAPPDAEFTIEVEQQKVTLPDGATARFELDSFRKHCLLKGSDGVQIGLANLARIHAYEEEVMRLRPWEQQIADTSEEGL